MAEQMMTPEQVADWLQVHKGTVYRWIDEGKLPALQVGRVYRIPREDVLAMVRRQDGEALPWDRDGWQQPPANTTADPEEWRAAIREVAEAEEVFTREAVRCAEAGAVGGSLPDVLKEAREELRARELPEQVAEQVDCLVQCAANVLKGREE